MRSAVAANGPHPRLMSAVLFPACAATTYSRLAGGCLLAFCLRRREGTQCAAPAPAGAVEDRPPLEHMACRHSAFAAAAAVLAAVWAHGGAARCHHISRQRYQPRSHGLVYTEGCHRGRSAVWLHGSKDHDSTNSGELHLEEEGDRPSRCCSAWSCVKVRPRLEQVV